jgi:hypothetical protein
MEAVQTRGLSAFYEWRLVHAFFPPSQPECFSGDGKPVLASIKVLADELRNGYHDRWWWSGTLASAVIPATTVKMCCGRSRWCMRARRMRMEELSVAWRRKHRRVRNRRGDVWHNLWTIYDRTVDRLQVRVRASCPSCLRWMLACLGRLIAVPLRFVWGIFSAYSWLLCALLTHVMCGRRIPVDDVTNAGANDRRSVRRGREPQSTEYISNVTCNDWTRVPPEFVVLRRDGGDVTVPAAESRQLDECIAQSDGHGGDGEFGDQYLSCRLRPY